MKHLSEGQAGGRGGTILRLALIAALFGAFCATFLIGAAESKAAPANYAFDNGVINLGGEDGTWAKLIDKEIGDPPATLKSEMAGDGSITAAATDFFFPLKKIENLDVRDVGYGILTYVDATIKISAGDSISGTFDTATGESDLTIPAHVLVNVYRAGESTSVAECEIEGFNLNLSTTSTPLSDPGDSEAEPARPAAEYLAAAFDSANGGSGAMIATWAFLPPASVVSGSLAGAVCPGLDGMLGGPGGAWLEGVAPDAEISGPPAPTAAPKLTGTPAASTALTDAEFTYTQGDAESSEVTGFQCKLDGGAFEACDSGSKAYSGLSAGTHTFEVKATNDGGEGPVTSFSWTVTGQSAGGSAKLAALKVAPKVRAVKRGKKAVFTVKVRNAGDVAAKAVKVCVTAPKRLVQVKKCVGLGQVAGGKAKTVKFKVAVKKSARRGAKARLTFKATSKNAKAKSAKATVKVR